MRKFFFITFLVCFTIIFTGADWSRDIRLSDNEGAISDAAPSVFTIGPGRVAASFDDNVYVVWADGYYQDNGFYNVFLKEIKYNELVDTLDELDLYYPAGVGGSIQEWNPVIATGRDGTIMVLWQDNRNLNYLIMSRFYNGSAWDTIKTISYEDAFRDQWVPDVVWNNGYHAVFQVIDEENNYIKYAFYDSEFEIWKDIKIISDTLSVGVYPSIAASSDNIMVAWYDVKKDKIMYRVLKDTLWDNVKEFPFTGFYPVIAGDGQGNFFMFYENNVNGVLKVYFSKYDGKNWSLNYSITPEGYNAYFPKCVYSNGVLHLVWLEDSSTTGSDIFYRSYDVKNNAWGNAEPVFSYSRGIFRPGITVDSYDNVYVFWADYRKYTLANGPDIYCKVRYNLSKNYNKNLSKNILFVTSDKSNVTVRSMERGYIYLFDVSGRLRWRTFIRKNAEITISEASAYLPSGVYTVVFRGLKGNIYESKRVIIR